MQPLGDSRIGHLFNRGEAKWLGAIVLFAAMGGAIITYLINVDPEVYTD